MEAKTNAVRLLDAKKIKYALRDYSTSGAVSGIEVADFLKENPEDVFKTLVTVGKSGGHYVFMVPANRELNLKKAAACAGEKHVEMVKAKELLPLTGYIHGGCSPLGMKKQFKTFIDASAARREKIFFSAGKIGLQVETVFSELQKVLPIAVADICD